jgi:hypothetical protein
MIVPLIDTCMVEPPLPKELQFVLVKGKSERMGIQRFLEHPAFRFDKHYGANRIPMF